MEPDWNLWRSFAAVVSEGSLSAAARKLSLSQPTLGRHIESLEATLGVRLFERTLHGLRASEAALRLFEPVDSARRALGEAALIAEGAQGTLDGTVRITASAIVSHYLLPDLLLPIRRAFPAIALELVSSDSAENLLMREADIAVRMFRPTQLELVTRKLGELPLAACAHESYLARAGTPLVPHDLAMHDLVGFDRSDLIVEGARANGAEVSRDSFGIRTDNQPLAFEMIRAGHGIGFAQLSLIRATPGLRVLLPGIRIPPLEVWLTTHRELFTSARIRAVYDALAQALVNHIARSSVQDAALP